MMLGYKHFWFQKTKFGSGQKSKKPKINKNDNDITWEKKLQLAIT